MNAWLIRQPVDLTPPRHEDFELSPRVRRVDACEVDHLGAVVSYGVDLGSVALNRLVSGDDEPTLRRHGWGPYGVSGGGGGGVEAAS